MQKARNLADGLERESADRNCDLRLPARRLDVIPGRPDLPSDQEPVLAAVPRGGDCKDIGG